jgi:peroxiredoxin
MSTSPNPPNPEQPVAATPVSPRPSGARNFIVLLVVIAVVAGMLFTAAHYAHKSKTGYDAALLGGDVRGMQAPDFDLKTLDGKEVKLSDYRGKAVLVNFWATWCDPCKIEMPWIIDLQNKYRGQGFEVIGIAMDDSGPDAIRRFAQAMGVNYTILQGKNAVGDAYGATGYPMSVYIDREGHVVDRVMGLVGKSEIEDHIEAALKGVPGRTGEPQVAHQPTGDPDEPPVPALQDKK